MRSITSLLVLGALGTGASAHERPWYANPGRMVAVTVEVDGRETPLYRAVDGSGRYYLEARQGSAYAVRLANRTGERLAVHMTVDGLNVISGTPASGRGPGRMYVLGPWESTVVRGWRSSLEDVRLFRFVDEKASYAVRSGQANGRLGWIELAVYRERRREVVSDHDFRRQAPHEEAPTARTPPPAEAPAADASGQAPANAPRAEAMKPSSEAESQARRDGGRSYPGTGWGERVDDRVQVVSFEAEAHPAETLTLRYEYRRALRALGIHVDGGRDRLTQRERGEGGFAKPPIW